MRSAKRQSLRNEEGGGNTMSREASFGSFSE
jgi:hypothetical protein